MSRLFHPHYVPARLFYEERWLTSRFIFSCGQRSLRGHTLVVLLLIILSTHGAGVDTTAAWDDPFKQNWIVNGDTRPGNMTGWNCINDITFQQNCTIRNGTSDTFSSRWCNGHQLGNQLSGPFVPGVLANLSCRVTQSINVLKFPRLLTYIRTGLVTMHVNATLGSDNDIARFEIQLSNDADLLAPSQALSTDFSMCMQPFYFASEVPRHTTFISATFSCWMTADGHSCDGWGSDFSVVFKVKRQITSSQTPSNRTTTLYISRTRGLTRSVNISTTHSKRLSTFVTHSGMESVTKTNAATGNSNSRSHSLSVVARYSSSLTMSIAVTNISSPSWSEIKGSNTSAPTPSSSGFLLYSKQLSNSARKLSAWMTTDQSSTLRSSISATHSAKSKSSCLFGAITPSTVPPKSTALPTTAPVTSVTSTVNVGVTAASALLGAAAGGALMQASLGAAPCANNNGETPADRSSNPAMFLVSPFYGINDYAMVFGNIALVIAAALLHLTVVVIGPRVSRRQNRSLLQNLTRFRFPNFTIQAAVYAAQGVAVGGWGLLWGIINPDDESSSGNGGAIVAKLLCWIISLIYPFLVVGAMWRIRLSLLKGDGVIAGVIKRFVEWSCCIREERTLDPTGVTLTDASSFSTHDIRNSTTREGTSDSSSGRFPTATDAGTFLPNDTAVSARNALNDFLPASQLLKRLSPLTFWQPRQARLMFGAAFVSIKPTVLMHPRQSYWWLVGDVLWLPIIVSVASTTKPSAAARNGACNSVMIVVAILLSFYAVGVAFARPFRVGARNLFSPFVTLLMAVTCLLAAPLIADHLTSSELANARGSVSALQSFVVLLLTTTDLVVLLTVDRQMVKLEKRENDAVIMKRVISSCAVQSPALFQPQNVENDSTSLIEVSSELTENKLNCAKYEDDDSLYWPVAMHQAATNTDADRSDFFIGNDEPSDLLAMYSQMDL